MTFAPMAGTQVIRARWFGWESRRHSSRRLHQPNRALRARHHAQAARTAGVGSWRVGGLLPVRPDFELHDERQRIERFVGHTPDLEDIVGADLDAVALALAAPCVHLGSEDARFGLAPASRSLRIGRRTLRFDRVLAHGVESVTTGLRNAAKLLGDMPPT
jgi:hypothetical protein